MCSQETGKRELGTSVKDLGEDDTQGDDKSNQSGWDTIHGIGVDLKIH